ncbi:ATP-binding protein [Devosia neptuniae]|uniref:AlbA family DNA-binding domain-containing protein n=1 Tax=Devosia neptuniae TaxID=191302 RepID=UPI0022AEA352|nr:ATP-binding protein [Devosia neptuniae]MCZ4347437.1 ATP-binding protein [Devosia neptuniae]
MDELFERIRDPVETLDTEYKDWVNLQVEVNRAKIARHIAALANFGGGYLVFGFSDKTMSPTGPNQFVAGYSHDDISGISKKYLDPAVHVGIRVLDGHVILLVPPHGAVPICIKKNGPDDAKNRPQEVTRGTFYTRKIGPESAPIFNESEWLPIIRRCVMHDKSSLLAALTSVMGGRADTIARPALLDQWHAALRSKYLKQDRILGTRIAGNNAQFSYAVNHQPEDNLNPTTLADVLREVNKESVDRVNTGWSMFFPFTRAPISPYFTDDADAGTANDEFLEANLLLDEMIDEDSDLWRVSPSGLASIIRPIRLDYLRSKPGWSEEYFSINEAARNVGQLVRHAEGLAQRFDSVDEITFMCEWHGLSNRTLGDPIRQWSPGRIARTDKKLTRGTWPLGEVIENWAQIVATLIAPLVRTFDPNLELTKEWVLGESEHWRPIGGQWP